MKKLSLLIVALALCIGTVTPALAVAVPSHASSSEISTRAEQTEWKYRYINGHTEKRLWSLTYSRWLTDWEPIV